MPSCRIDVVLPADTNRTGLRIAYKSTAWGGETDPAVGTIVVDSSSPVTGTNTFTVDIPAGSWYFRAFTTGPGGSAAKDPTSTPTVVTSPAGTTTFFDRPFTGTLNADVADNVNFAASALGVDAGWTVKYQGDGSAIVSANAAVAGVSGKVLLEYLPDLNFDFAAGDASRYIGVEFDVPASQSANVSAFLTASKNAIPEAYGQPNWTNIEFRGSLAAPAVIVQRAEAGAVAVEVGTTPLTAAGGPGRHTLYLLIDRSKIAAAVYDRGVTKSLLTISPTTHALHAYLNSLRLVLEFRIINDAATTIRIRRIFMKAARASAPAVSIPTARKADNNPWNPAAGDAVGLYTQTFYPYTPVASDPAMPFRHIAKVDGVNAAIGTVSPLVGGPEPLSVDHSYVALAEAESPFSPLGRDSAPVTFRYNPPTTQPEDPPPSGVTYFTSLPSGPSSYDPNVEPEVPPPPFPPTRLDPSPDWNIARGLRNPPPTSIPDQI